MVALHSLIVFVAFVLASGSSVTEEYDSTPNISATPLGPNSIGVSWDVDEMKGRDVSVLIAVAVPLPDSTGNFFTMGNVDDGEVTINGLAPSTPYRVKVVGLGNGMIGVDGEEVEEEEEEEEEEEDYDWLSKSKFLLDKLKSTNIYMVKADDDQNWLEKREGEIFIWTTIVETLPQDATTTEAEGLQLL